MLEWTRRGPDDGGARWSSRRLARKLGIGASVARIWRRHGLQPRRLRHFIASNDPAFEAKSLRHHWTTSSKDMSAGLGDLAADAECARGWRQCSDRERGGRM